MEIMKTLFTEQPRRISPKGIVEPEEMRGLCDRLRVLLMLKALGQRGLARHEWDELQRYTMLMRCFTVLERDHIINCYGRVQRK